MPPCLSATPPGRYAVIGNGDLFHAPNNNSLRFPRFLLSVLTQSCGVLKGSDAEETLPDVSRMSVLIHASILP